MKSFFISQAVKELGVKEEDAEHLINLMSTYIENNSSSLDDLDSDDFLRTIDLNKYIPEEI